MHRWRQARLRQPRALPRFPQTEMVHACIPARSPSPPRAAHHPPSHCCPTAIPLLSPRLAPLPLRDTPPPLPLRDGGSYLNEPDVRAAIHASATPQAYEECSGAAGHYLARVDGLGVRPQLEALLARGSSARGGPRLLFYAGQFDVICNHVGVEQLLEVRRASRAPRDAKRHVARRRRRARVVAVARARRRWFVSGARIDTATRVAAQPTVTPPRDVTAPDAARRSSGPAPIASARRAAASGSSPSRSTSRRRRHPAARSTRRPCSCRQGEAPPTSRSNPRAKRRGGDPQSCDESRAKPRQTTTPRGAASRATAGLAAPLPSSLPQSGAIARSPRR